MTLSPRTPLEKISKKQRAKREQAGETKIFSTIARHPRKAPKKTSRPKAETDRIYGGDYGDWIRSLPCLGCGLVGFTDQAHVTTGGMGRKADSSLTVPLCGPHPSADGRKALDPGCHRAYDAAKTSWPAAKHFDMRYEAAKLVVRWQQLFSAASSDGAKE